MKHFSIIEVEVADADLRRQTNANSLGIGKKQRSLNMDDKVNILVFVMTFTLKRRNYRNANRFACERCALRHCRLKCPKQSQLFRYFGLARTEMY